MLYNEDVCINSAIMNVHVCREISRHHSIASLVDDAVLLDGELGHVEHVDVAALHAEEEPLLGGLEAHDRDLLEPPLHRSGLLLHQVSRTAELPQVERVVRGEGDDPALAGHEAHLRDGGLVLVLAVKLHSRLPIPDNGSRKMFLGDGRIHGQFFKDRRKLAIRP